MLTKNVHKIMKSLKPKDIVLDIGGWTKPFNRANYVVDIMPYETRGIHGSEGGNIEYFSKKTWITQDVSATEKLPFKNKEIDFVICSQVLEDIRDPIHLCSEMVRIGKSGYIEVPSRIFESIKGLHGKSYVGYPHHRWLVEIKNYKLTFRFKYHQIHDSWKYHLPGKYLDRLKEEEKVSFLFWKNKFEFREIINVSPVQVSKELEQFIKEIDYYPAYYYILDKFTNIRQLVKDLLLANPRLRKIGEKYFGNTVVLGLREESFWRETKPNT